MTHDPDGSDEDSQYFQIQKIFPSVVVAKHHPSMDFNRSLHKDLCLRIERYRKSQNWMGKIDTGTPNRLDG